MREGLGDDKKPRSKLGLASALALFASLAGGAHAGEIKSFDAKHKEISHLSKQNDLNSFSKEEVTRLEGSIESNTMPLKLQVKFMEEALRQDGRYTRELLDAGLKNDRLSQIYRLANAVSARLTLAYTDLKQDKELKKYFHMADQLREATVLFPVEVDNKPEHCNKFFVRDGGEVFSATAFHCIYGTPQAEGYHRPSHTDIAVKYVPKEEWAKEGIKDVSKLPSIHPRANHSTISGRVVTAFSRGPDNKPKAHFSFAMPLPANISFVFNEKELPRLKLSGADEWMMYFKPYGEGLKNPETGKTYAAGSSGGPIAVEGLGVVGTFNAAKRIADTCYHVCYASAFFSPPEALKKGIEEERMSRKKQAMRGMN